MIDERFVFLGAAISIYGTIAYIVDTLRGRSQPNRVTFALWALAPLVGFAGELSEGVGLRAAFTFLVGAQPLSILVASFISAHGYWELKARDFIFGGLSIIGLVLWLLTGEGSIAILFAILADGLALMPTLLKSLQDPASETPVTYLTCAINAIIALFVVDRWTFPDFGFPAYILVACTILFVVTQFKIGPRISQRRARATTSS